MGATSPGSDAPRRPLLESLRRQLSVQGVPDERLRPALRFQLATIRALAAGRPVGVEQVAAVLALPEGDVRATFAQMHAMGAEFDSAGRLVGNVLTLNPTPHRLRIDGIELYSWCALDALFLPAYVGRTAEVSSSCPVTAETVRLTVSPTGVDALEPASAVMSIVDRSKLADCRPGPDSALCGSMRFFVSDAAGARWTEQHPHAVILTVPEGYAIAQVYIDIMRAAL